MSECQRLPARARDLRGGALEHDRSRKPDEDCEYGSATRERDMCSGRTVVEPGACGAKRNAARAHARREDLRGEDPRHGPERHAVRQREEVQEAAEVSDTGIKQTDGRAPYRCPSR